MELLPDGRPQNKQPCHNKINRAVGKAHPNIFKLVELFKTEQVNTEVSMVQLAAGVAVGNTKKYSTKQKELAKIGEKFERGDYTLEGYCDRWYWQVDGF